MKPWVAASGSWKNVTKFFTSSPLHVSLLFLVSAILLLVQHSILIHPHNVLGQNQALSASKVQTWTDNLSNIKTEFTYLPASPDIDKPIELKFNVVHLQNGTNLGDLSARVIILTTSGGQERSFIFPNVVTQNGSFSVNYLFPDSGSYQVISRINSKGFLTLASFSVFVPILSGGTTSTGNVSLLVFAASIAGIIGILAVVALKYIERKRRGHE